MRADHKLRVFHEVTEARLDRAFFLGGIGHRIHHDAGLFVFLDLSVGVLGVHRVFEFGEELVDRVFAFSEVQKRDRG